MALSSLGTQTLHTATQHSTLSPSLATACLCSTAAQHPLRSSPQLACWEARTALPGWPGTPSGQASAQQGTVSLQSCMQGCSNVQDQGDAPLVLLAQLSALQRPAPRWAGLPGGPRQLGCCMAQTLLASSSQQLSLVGRRRRVAAGWEPGSSQVTQLLVSWPLAPLH